MTKPNNPTSTAPLSATDLTPLPQQAHPVPAVQPPPGVEPEASTDLALPSGTPWIDAHGFDPAEFK